MTASPASQLSSSLHRDASLDALRGLAALCVLFFHARGVFWTGFGHAWHQYGLHPDFNAALGYLSEPFSYGFLGVNLFFVLSGYCIHRRGAQKLAENPDATLDWMAFLRRRFWRIYPTYVAALLLTALVDWWISGRQVITHADQDNSLAAFLVSLLTLQGYLRSYFGDNAVFWTLAIEVHLYLVYPALFHLSKRFGPRKAVLFTLVIAVAYILADRIFGIESRLPYRAVQGPVFLPYWFTWTMGFYLAEVEANRTADFSERAWTWMMVAGFLLGLPPILHGAHPEFADLFWALFFAGIVRWSLKPAGKILSAGWLGGGLAGLGVMSYSLYAVHNPMLGVYHSLIAPMYHYQFATLWPTIGAALFTLPCAWVFFQLIERWSLRVATAPVSVTRKAPLHG